MGLFIQAYFVTAVFFAIAFTVGAYLHEEPPKVSESVVAALMSLFWPFFMLVVLPTVLNKDSNGVP